MVGFYIGLHQPSDAQHFDRCCISVNRIRERRRPFAVKRWLMDSGAFTEIFLHGHYRFDVKPYGASIRRWKDCGELEAAVAQDYMCEAHMLKKTGHDIPTHQRLTIERYDALLDEDAGAYIMPVLQGYAPTDYLHHLDAYGARLADGAWVGVGSVCKRNGSPQAIVDVLSVIKGARPDLRLHGFGVKRTAISDGRVRALLGTADSMAWSFAARREKRNQNDWREAKAYVDMVDGLPSSVEPWQVPLPLR